MLDSVIPRKNSLHMLFVFFPLDILWLDEHFNIVDIKLHVNPFAPLVPSTRLSRYVVEITAGQGHSFSVGERLSVKFKKN